MGFQKPMQDISTANNSEDDSNANAASSSKISNPEDGENVNLSNADEKKVDKKTRNQPAASVMVLESIQSLKKRNGATVEDIYQQIEATYNVEIKKVKPYVSRFMNSAVEKGLLENVGGTGDKARFKAKKSENVKKQIQKPKESVKKEKTENKSVAKGQKRKKASS